jgi:hypothetical protein
MAIRRKLGMAVVGLAAPLLTLAMAGTGAATASTVTSTVATVDSCAWQMSSVPSSFTLTPTVLGAKFEGNILPLSARIPDLALGLAGRLSPDSATVGTSAECSFYGALETTKINLELLESTTFTSSYLDADGVTHIDANYVVALNQENPLRVQPTGGSDSCGIYAGMFLGAPVSLISLDQVEAVGWAAWVAGSYAQGQAPRCTASYGFEMYLPQVGPDNWIEGYGFSYTFTGPELTFSLSQDTYVP